VARIATANPRLTVQFTKRGGHVGFLAGAIPFKPVYWGERRILSFFQAHAGDFERRALVR
jgi:predicted alpha/beta-fold hydrolase